MKTIKTGKEGGVVKAKVKSSKSNGWGVIKNNRNMKKGGGVESKGWSYDNEGK